MIQQRRPTPAVVRLAVAWVLMTAADWPQYRGGPGHTGVAEGSLGSSLQLRWTFKTGES